MLPMYMGVILAPLLSATFASSAPHVYGGDPEKIEEVLLNPECSPCIWG